jgi:hypothetical protein
MFKIMKHVIIILVQDFFFQLLAYTYHSTVYKSVSRHFQAWSTHPQCRLDSFSVTVTCMIRNVRQSPFIFCLAPVQKVDNMLEQYSL